MVKGSAWHILDRNVVHTKDLKKEDMLLACGIKSEGSTEKGGLLVGSCS